ncbi:MAG: hypothetical protein M0023_01590 [Desulfobacteraceae bacterium]|nr:hypothetical protein [Desulfobacteraceae bacterium]
MKYATSNRIALLALVLVVSLGLATAYGTQPAQPPSGPVSGQQEQIITVIGVVLHDARGYFIRGHVPAEVFRITNPNPAMLDGIVKSGQGVRLQVRSMVGDNVAIVSIDGAPY